MITKLIEIVYAFLWGDLFTLPVMGSSVGISLMLLLLIPAGIYFTIRTRLLPLRLFSDMMKALKEKKETPDSLSSLQTLIISTATRVGMGNLVGVVAAVSLGGAGAVFWMWVTALLGASTAFVEAALAQKYKEPDPLYGGYHGGPAYYIHHFVEAKTGKTLRHSLTASLFAISGLICWCGISQVISNSVASAFANAFRVPPIVTARLFWYYWRSHCASEKCNDKSSGCYCACNGRSVSADHSGSDSVKIGQIPAVLERIFSEAFGLRQAVAGGIGAVIMNGVKRGLFSNEAGSGSAPCAAATAKTDHPAKVGLVQALGVLLTPL